MNKVNAAVDKTLETVATSVESSLNSSKMKKIHDDNAMRAFDAICKDSSPTIIEKLKDTAKDILTQDSWITQHIKQVASNAVGYQKDNLQKYVENTINSDSSRQLINTLAKSAVGEWAAIISDEKPTNNNNGTRSNSDVKEDKDKKEHHPKFGEAFNQIEKRRPESTPVENRKH